MNTNELMTMGLGLTPPWSVGSASFSSESNDGILELMLKTERGSTFPCPECGCQCKAYDYQEFSWEHLNFFQHKCVITARVPRIKCKKHGVRRINVPWSRPGSGFTLLYEQALLLFCREMPVAKVAEITGINDKRIWRVLEHYVYEAMSKIDLSKVFGIGVDETASKRGHKYVTIFVDMDRETRPVIFATPGKGKETFNKFADFLVQQGGDTENIIEVVCDMSKAFLAAAEENFEYSTVTVDWFHVVQLFTRAVDEVRRKEAKAHKMPEGARWAVVKAKETNKTEEQELALKQLQEAGLETSKAFLIKEKARWVKGADTKKNARWRAKCFLTYARKLMSGCKYLEPMKKALETFEKHITEIISRWDSQLTNARLEGLNSLFQAVRARARGYRNVNTFITMIYLIGAPIGKLLNA